jgi:hypothetical protein
MVPSLSDLQSHRETVRVAEKILLLFLAFHAAGSL